MNDSLLGLLDKDFVDDPYDLAGVGMVKRATAVAGVSGSVQLNDIIRRGQASDHFLVQELTAELRYDHRRDGGDDGAVGGRVESQDHADRVAGERAALAFAHSVGVTQSQRGEPLTGDLDGLAHIDPIPPAYGHGNDFFSVAVDLFE